MKEIKDESKVVDPTARVMAAMNISDELFHIKDRKGSNSEALEIKADALISC